MIIENQEKLKAQLGGIQGNMKFDTVMPFVKTAEKEFRKIVGIELYEFLEEAELEGSQVGQEDFDELKDLACGCIAWASFDMALPHLKMRVGDLGLLKTSPSQTVSVAKWEYADTRDANLAMVDLHWDLFWEKLEETRPKPWTDSPAYQWRNLYFIRSSDEISQFAPITGKNRRLFSKLEAFINRAEQLYIRETVTHELFDELKLKWQDKDAQLTALEKLLVAKIQEPLAFLILHEAYPYLPVKLDENGLREVRKWDGTTNESTAGADLRNAQRAQLWQDAQLYLGRLRTFLDQYSTPTQFAQYYTAALAEKANEEQEDFTNKSHVIL